MAALGGLTWPLAAAGADPVPTGVPISLRYQAPASCPSLESVADELAARGLHPSSTGSPTRLRIAVGLVAPDARAFAGKLTIDSSTRTPDLSQTVSGRDCRAVVLSLVVVAALAVNPAADVAISTTPRPNEAAIHPASGVVAATRPTWFVGAAARGMTALGADPAPGAGVFVERVWGGRSDDQTSAAISVVFTAAVVAPPTIALSSGSASLRAFLGRWEACWFGGLVASPRLLLSPCATVEGGVVQGTGTIDRPETATRPWFAPSIAARGAVRLTRAVWFSFDASVFVPLVRDTFVFNDPRTTIHRTPALGGNLELGLGVAFW